MIVLIGSRKNSVLVKSNRRFHEIFKHLQFLTLRFCQKHHFVSISRNFLISVCFSDRINVFTKYYKHWLLAVIFTVFFKGCLAFSRKKSFRNCFLEEFSTFYYNFRQEFVSVLLFLQKMLGVFTKKMDLELFVQLIFRVFTKKITR